MKRTILYALALAALLFTTPASATILTYTFSGTYDAVDSTPGFGTDQFGPTFTASVTVDSSIGPALGDGVTNSEWYYSDFRVNAGYQFVADPAPPFPLNAIEIDNDLNGFDALAVQGLYPLAGTGGPIGTYTLEAVELALAGPTSLWDTPALPTTLPQLSDFSAAHPLFFFFTDESTHTNAVVEYQITDVNVTASPEPSSFALVGLLGAGLVMWRKRRSKPATF